jgi:hypothetical protein
MYIINKVNKTATAIEKKKFSDLGFTERYDLQEWIANQPSILGEDLLIIQKEFDGFSDTKERLDLLALDTRGNIVIIENKLDDSGKDVVWQALKYVSYCATLKKSEIVDIYQNYLGTSGNAEDKLAGFFKGDFDNVKLNPQDGDQRIILVAANFRKEVTSTVLWLRDHGVDIKCVRVTPYQDVEKVFLDATIILPVPEVAEYQIKIRGKKQEDIIDSKDEAERHKLRREFWTMALPILGDAIPIYKSISPTQDNWVTGASGCSGVAFSPIVLKNGFRCDIYIDVGDKERNKKIFHTLNTKKEEYESSCGFKLTWQELEDKKACRICISNDSIGGLMERDSWIDGANWLAENMKKLYDTFKKSIEEAVKLNK